ncbi:hypothetical protein PGT21_020977 [Puccinia graminis f. sp. tritici]|uniref:Uncharacterized protein n=1 Tax=Puccinia graminis f. sp. tritici TaxID=56615 RepID=A0A5B0QTN1_PUCGR|nr:hypothetical protein PGT21_020977 [Puccinia graminis f. sp. tritici]
MAFPPHLLLGRFVLPPPPVPHGSHSSASPAGLTSISPISLSAVPFIWLTMLPFSNIEGASQKLYLGEPRRESVPFETQLTTNTAPAQTNDGPLRVMKIYHKHPSTESQLAAAGGGSLTPGNLRVIAIDYLVFNRTATNQITHAIPSALKGSPAASSKEWEKITPTFDTVWKAALKVWSWPNVQQCIITLLRDRRPLVADHLVNFQEKGLLKWQCILANHLTYGANKNHFVHSDKDFTPFVAAVIKKPAAKVTIKLVMDDPARSAKKRQAEQSQDNSLAMSYALNDERVALQRLQTRVVLNLKCDQDSAARTRFVVEITNHITSTYGCDSESLHIKDPDDPACLMRVTRDGLFVWSRALVHGAQGVTIEVPPATKEFVSEPIQIYTLAEQRPLDGRQGGKSLSAKPGAWLALGTTKFTAPRVTASGRIRPPCIIPAGQTDVATATKSPPSNASEDARNARGLSTDRLGTPPGGLQGGGGEETFPKGCSSIWTRFRTTSRGQSPQLLA